MNYNILGTSQIGGTNDLQKTILRTFISCHLLQPSHLTQVVAKNKNYAKQTQFQNPLANTTPFNTNTYENRTSQPTTKQTQFKPNPNPNKAVRRCTQRGAPHKQTQTRPNFKLIKRCTPRGAPHNPQISIFCSNTTHFSLNYALSKTANFSPAIQMDAQKLLKRIHSND